MLRWLGQRLIARLDLARFGVRTDGRRDLERVRSMAQTLLTGALDAALVGDLAGLRPRGEALEPYLRPFYFEGVGMGYSLRSLWDLRARRLGVLATVRSVHPDFVRLAMAGLGMWYEARWRDRPRRVERLIAALPPDLRYFCVDGYGFGSGLFREPSFVLVAWRPFSPGIQRAYCHGLARGFLIRYGDDPERILAALDPLPPHLRQEAYSGLGMGLAFTRIDDLPRVFAWGDLLPEAGRPYYFLGVTLGLYIHAVGQAAWVRETIERQAPLLTEAQGLWAMDALYAPVRCAAALRAEDPNVHWRFREALLPRLAPPSRSAGLLTQKGVAS